MYAWVGTMWNMGTRKQYKTTQHINYNICTVHTKFLQVLIFLHPVKNFLLFKCQILPSFVRINFDL